MPVLRYWDVTAGAYLALPPGQTGMQGPQGPPGTGSPNLPPPVTTGTTIQSYTDPLGDIWIAKNGVNGGNWKRPRDVLHSQMSQNGAYNSPTSMTYLGFDTVIRDLYGIYTLPYFLTPIAGIWSFFFQFDVGTIALGNWMNAILSNLSTSNYLASRNAAAAAVGAVICAAQWTGYLPAGTQVQPQFNASGVYACTPGPSNTFAYCNYLGTG